MQVGEPSVTPPNIADESMTTLLEYCVVMDIAGLLEDVLWVALLVGIGFVWSTPEKAYAPTTTDVEPLIVTTMFPVPLGFVRYQNSASLLVKDDTFFVSDVPLNVIEVASPLFASTPTTSVRLLPVPTLKLEIVICCTGNITEPDVDCTLDKVIPPCALAVWDCMRFDGSVCSTGNSTRVRITRPLKMNLEVCFIIRLQIYFIE